MKREKNERAKEHSKTTKKKKKKDLYFSALIMSVMFIAQTAADNHGHVCLSILSLLTVFNRIFPRAKLIKAFR
jgi:hypothetical protein